MSISRKIVLPILLLLFSVGWAFLAFQYLSGDFENPSGFLGVPLLIWTYALPFVILLLISFFLECLEAVQESFTA